MVDFNCVDMKKVVEFSYKPKYLSKRINYKGISTDKNPHKGHRQRVKNRVAKEGIDSFEDHQILELLLFYCIPMKDTNELAHNHPGWKPGALPGGCGCDPKNKTGNRSHFHSRCRSHHRRRGDLLQFCRKQDAVK